MVICIMGLKLLRSSFSDSSRQHMVLLWTVLFFHFDYSYSSETFVVDYFFMSIFMSKVSRGQNGIESPKFQSFPDALWRLGQEQIHAVGLSGGWYTDLTRWHRIRQ